jgi:hypothetical protein
MHFLGGQEAMVAKIIGTVIPTMEVTLCVHNIVEAGIDVFAFTIVVDGVIDNHVDGVRTIDFGDFTAYPFFLGFGPNIVLDIRDIGDESLVANDGI